MDALSDDMNDTGLDDEQKANLVKAKAAAAAMLRGGKNEVGNDMQLEKTPFQSNGRLAKLKTGLKVGLIKTKIKP